MKKRTMVLYITVVVLVIAAWACLMPGSKKIDMELQAMEYSFADPDYAVAHTVTIQGCDTRNILGKGEFEGIFAVDGWETAGEGWHTVAAFPEPHTYTNVWYENSAGYWTSTKELCALLPNRTWTAFVGLLPKHNGPDSAYLDTKNCRFLVSGTLSRDEAITLAQDLTNGTTLEPIFADR